MAASGKLEGAVAVTVEADEWEALAGSSPTEKLKSALAASRCALQYRAVFRERCKAWQGSDGAAAAHCQRHS